MIRCPSCGHGEFHIAGTGKSIHRFLWLLWSRVECYDAVCRKCAAPWMIRAGSVTTPTLPVRPQAKATAPRERDERDGARPLVADQDLAPEPVAGR